MSTKTPFSPQVARAVQALTRRSFLSALGMAAGGVAFSNLFPTRAFAAGDPLKSRRFVFAYFEGGWDLLLGLDPRSPTTTNAAQHKIEPAYDRLAYQFASRGVQTAGALSFGPAVPQPMLQLASECSIINGIVMDTAAHEVGRRYFITGRFPRGLQAVGSSTGAEIVAQAGESSPIPHMAVGMEAYSTGLPPFAAPLMVNSLSDLFVALRPLATLDPEIRAAVEAYQDQPVSCEAGQLNRDGLVTQLRKSVESSRGYLAAQLDQIFDVTRTDAEMTALRQLYSTDAAQGDVGAPELLALIAGQAIKAKVSQCVSVRVAQTLDTHADWANDHAPRLERGFRALAALIQDLKNTPSTDSPGKSMLDETTILAFSEFGRTPLFNNIQGRDHFLGNSVLVAGAGVKGGITIGRSAEVGMMPVHTDLSSGAGVESPTQQQLDSGEVEILTPKHVLATLLESANLDSEYLRTKPIAGLIQS